MSAIESLSNKDDEVLPGDEINLEEDGDEDESPVVDEKPKKSLKSNLPYLAVGGLIVLGAGYGVFSTFMKKPQAQQMVSMDQVVAPVDASNQGLDQDLNAAPLQGGPAPVPAPTPVEQSNVGKSGMAMPVEPAPAQAAVPVVEGGQMAQVGSGGMPVPPMAVPTAQQAMQAPQTITPAMPSPAMPDVTQAVPATQPVAMGNDVEIQGIKSAVVNLNDRVSALESARSSKTSSTPSGSSRAESAPKPKRSKEKTERTQKSSDFVRLEDDAKVTSTSTTAEVKAASCQHYAVYALKDGRAWVKTADGDTQTVVAGGSIGGMKVKAIDEVTGVIQTANCLIK